MRRMSKINPWRLYLPIGGKILLFFFIIIIVLGGGYYYYTMDALSVQLRNKTKNELHSEYRGITQLYRSKQDMVGDGMSQALSERFFREAILSHSTVFLNETLKNYAVVRPYVDVWVIVDEKQKVIARANGTTGDFFEVNGIVSSALASKEQIKTTEKISREFLASEKMSLAATADEAVLMQFVITPVIVKNQSKGAIINGILIDNSKWFPEATVDHFATVSALFSIDGDNSKIITTPINGDSIFNSFRILPKDISYFVKSQQDFEGRLILNNMSAYIVAKPILNFSGAVIGGIVIGKNSNEYNIVTSVLKRDLLVLTGLSVILSLIFAGFAYKTTMGSVKTLTIAMDKVSKGDMDVRADLDTKDELERIGDGFNLMLNSMKIKQKTLDRNNELSKVLMASLEPEYILKNSLIKLIELTNSQVGIIYLFNEKKGTLEPNSSYGINEVDLRSFKVGDGMVGMCAGKKEKFVQRDIPEDCYSLEAGIIKLRPKAVALFPILLKHRLIGVLAIGTTNHYSTEDISDLDYMMQSLSIAIDNALVHKEVERLSIVDGLTGLNNRRYFFDIFKQEFAKAKRHQYPLSILLFDIDNFKHINDQYGHPVGDNVLKGIGALIRKQTRSTDLWARFGGEEFIGCLLHCEKEDAFRIAEKLREAVENESFPGLPEKVTISVGLASYPCQDIDTTEKFVGIADQRLYDAKESGKNVVIA